MEQIDWKLDNIKCGGCGRTIEDKLKNWEGVADVEVIPEEGRVLFTVTEGVYIEAIGKALCTLGYPPAGTSSGMQKARSYVSCAIGRMKS